MTPAPTTATRPRASFEGSEGSDGFELGARPPSVAALVRDVWRARSLMRMLARKDFFVRYRRATFGVLWAVGLPLVQAVVLAVVFTRVVRIETDAPFGAFVFAGILPWAFFSGALTQGSTSIVDGQSLATKVYFPRAVLPLVVVGANLYGFLPGLGILLGVTAVMGVSIGPDVVLLVPATLLLVTLAAAFALVLAALHVYFRDVRFVVQAALMAWFYATPIFYPLDFAGGWVRAVIEANPATGVVQLFRAATTGVSGDWMTSVWWAIGWTVALLAAATLTHRRLDRLFVDLL